MLAVVYLASGALLLVSAAVDPKWGVPGFLVLGGWLVFVGIRCAGNAPVRPLVRRTAWVFVGIAGVGTVLGVWQHLAGVGNGTDGLLGGRVSLPAGLGAVSALVAAASFLSLRHLPN